MLAEYRCSSVRGCSSRSFRKPGMLPCDSEQGCQLSGLAQRFLKVCGGNFQLLTFQSLPHWHQPLPVFASMPARRSICWVNTRDRCSLMLPPLRQLSCKQRTHCRYAYHQSTSSSTGLLQMPLPFIHRLLPQMNGFFHLSYT